MHLYHTSKYVKHFSWLSVANIVILGFAIGLFTVDYITYSNVLQSETNQWDKGLITEFVSVSATERCPFSYEPVTGYFAGTETYCDFNKGKYTLGKCAANSTGKTKYGEYSRDDLDVINGKRLCAYRTGITYHEIAVE